MEGTVRILPSTGKAKRTDNKRQTTKRTPVVYITKNNNLIQSIGKTTLLSNKVFLMSLMKITDRDKDPVIASDKPYYKSVQEKMGTDFSKGLVAEFACSELRNLMENNSGSFYQTIADLLDPRSNNNLASQWSIYVKDQKNGSLGFTNMITATFYDNECGRMFIKFNQEKKVRDLLLDYKNNFTKLNYTLMMRFKSVHTYRLYEILMSRIGYEDSVTRTKKNQYSFTYNLAELKYMIGVLDPKISKEVSNAIQASKPDYERIERASGEGSMLKYADFRRYLLDKVKKEIDEASESEFYFDFEPVRGGRGGKVVAIDLMMTRKVSLKEKAVEQENKTISGQEREEKIDEIHKLICTTLKTWVGRTDCIAIAKAADYDYWKVKAALDFALSSGGRIDNITGFLISAIKDDYSSPIPFDPTENRISFD